MPTQLTDPRGSTVFTSATNTPKCQINFFEKETIII